MPACKVKGCRSRSGIDNVKMNSFPKESERRTVWIKNIGLKQDPSKYAVVCEEHFTSDMWEKVRQDGSRKLKCNAVPTIFREESESN
ncbi:peroxynitrite isomerase THAP4-like [Diabrotica virgifera virgifera]|uniref:THAP-type domain-containing protein n=1 Tax=Diabrotica virgifera virgifera TaxID=50390 RepID=A0ABM5IQ67_DIAVI|nr:peroxynitrite isomerase THAP4-like [Diabrotica virgifera virgifera]